MKNIINLIEDTPLIQLNLDSVSAKVLVKLENYNLTGSIKDRMALFMLKKAHKNGRLKNGSTIIEATTGNTGISFAVLASIFGYKMVVVMPENMSKERVKLLKLYGAKVILTNAKKGPIGAIKKRDQLAKTISNSWVPGQFSNWDNIKSHEKGIAMELLNQINGNIDYLVHGVGTGGTLMGVAKVLKKEIPNIKIVAVEPNESAVLCGKKAGRHNIQGIGEGFIPSLVDKSLIDKVIRVKTSEAIRETKKLMKGHGLFVGISSGANVSAIKKLAEKSNNPKTILTIFADSGNRYLSIF